MKAADLVRIAEISYRQLDYWTTKGWLVPYGIDNPGQGIDREFPYHQVQKARLMKCLITVGFETGVAEKIASFAQAGEFKLAMGHGITITIESHEHQPPKKK